MAGTMGLLEHGDHRIPIGPFQLAMHGAAYLNLRTDTNVQQRAKSAMLQAGSVVFVLFALAGLWVAFGVEGYRMVSAIDGNAYINPLNKVVEKVSGPWFSEPQRVGRE